MLYANLDRAEVGWGMESLKAAMAEWARLKQHVSFTNISRNDLYKDCQMRFFWDYVHGDTGVVAEDATPFHAFALGTASHDGAESLLQTYALHGKCEPELAAEIARASALEEWGEHAESFTQKNFDHNDAFLNYIDDVMRACARKIESTVDEVIATEQIVWACVPMCDIASASDEVVEWVCVLGRADAFIVKDETVYHLQHKTTSKTGDYEAFVAKLAFGGHETGYGWIATRLMDQGLMPGNIEGMKYGGSIVNMIQKRAKPDTQAAPLAKKILEAVEKLHVIIETHGGGLGTHNNFIRGKCTDKQWESALGTWSKWVDGEQKRLATIADYNETVVQFLDVDLDDKKITDGMYNIVWAAFGQRAIEELDLEVIGKHPGMVQRNTNACERFGSNCPRIESVTCGGWENYDLTDPDSGWARRPDDYINEVRNLYRALEEGVSDGAASNAG